MPRSRAVALLLPLLAERVARMAIYSISARLFPTRLPSVAPPSGGTGARLAGGWVSFLGVAGRVIDARCFGSTVSLPAIARARSQTLRSSRTLPGQACDWSIVTASEETWPPVESIQ